ncbi:hypothetical protein KY289_021926 [Solanum tuberosum]|nr:hypothetical protein KY289_021926 [Solanum tuberosum]
MDRYQKVEKPRVETPIDANEIRITSQGRMRSYITYAMTLLQEKESEEIVFKAMGRAINKTVTIVELIKRRIVGLHQVTSITSTDITDTWEPLEEGLLPLETTRHVSMITITLSKKELDKNAVGYQQPLPADQKDLLVVDGEAAVVEEGEGPEAFQEMDLCWLSTMMVGMIAIGAMVGVGVEAEVVASVAVEGEGTMVHRMPSQMVASTIKKLPCRDEAVAVEGELVVGDVDSDLMGRSKAVVLKWSKLEEYRDYVL